MVTNAFIGMAGPPTEAQLAEALASARPLWDRLIAALAEEHGLTSREWSSHSRKAGWSLRIKQRDRNIVYLTPGRGALMASFALGEAAMKAAREARFPPRVVAILEGARRYAEGSAVRIEVGAKADVDAVVRLAAIKLAH